MTLFRPCIDIHSGVVKQIVGGSLKDGADAAVTENFVSEQPASYYAEMYARDALAGGHVIMLGKGNEEVALEALKAYPNALQVGGGVTAENARKWIDAGASQVIVTSYMFEGNVVSEGKIKALKDAAGGREKLVLDLSCKKVGDGWVVAKDRWQTLTDLEVTHANLDRLAEHCCEFLVHAADVEGKCQGIDEALVAHLGAWGKIPITYAGGAKAARDLARVHELSAGRVHLTFGSALDVFGGTLVRYADCVAWNRAVSAAQRGEAGAQEAWDKLCAP